jgi:glycosyltransferase involved in cell wall biosynthesis
VRILILENIPTPHCVPVFDVLGQLPGISLTVAYLGETEGHRKWQAGQGTHFEHVVLPGRQMTLFSRWDTFSLHLNPTIRSFLGERRWDVLINSGWQHVANWIAFAHFRRRHLPSVLWSGSTANERTMRRSLTLPLVRYMVARSDAWVSYGEASAEYLATLGADLDRVERGYHPVDNQTFLAQCDASREAAGALRKEYGLEGRRVILFVGRLVETKGITHLIDALGLDPRLADVRLLIAGDGRLRADYERRAEQRAPGRVIFAGHVDLDRLPAFYQMADVFALPSLHEVWGLVINEAALAGLPVVATAACGAACDLIEDGRTGYVVPPADSAALAEALARVLDDLPAARRMGEAGRMLVSERSSPQVLARALAAAAERAQTRRNGAC